MSACACHQLTEATLAFPTQDIDRKEEITLWGPETLYAMPGAAAFMQGEDAWGVVYELSVEAGMHWDQGPYMSSLQAVLTELDDPKESIQDPEIEAALDLWRAGEDNMDDLHEPSHFLEWNQGEGAETWAHSTVYAPRRAVGEGAETWVGGAELGNNNAKIQQYTPEMLEQRERLNWMYNFVWNKPEEEHDTEGWVLSHWATDSIPDQCENLELVAVGDNYAVAKCPYGAVYIPKSGLKYLEYKGYLFGGAIGSQFKGRITFTPFQKFPWRLKKDGITHSIAACEDYYDDY
jgi:hypothetical protein